MTQCLPVRQPADQPRRGSTHQLWAERLQLWPPPGRGRRWAVSSRITLARPVFSKWREHASGCHREVAGLSGRTRCKGGRACRNQISSDLYQPRRVCRLRRRFLSACRQTRAQSVPRIFPRTRRGATYHAQEVTPTPPKGAPRTPGSRRKEGRPTGRPSNHRTLVNRPARPWSGQRNHGSCRATRPAVDSTSDF